MDVSADQIAALKQQHGTLYEGTISFRDRDDQDVEVSFLFREPRQSDAEMMIAGKDPIVSYQHLLRSVIVHPDKAQIMDRVRDYPMAMTKFCDSEILPLFGFGATTARRRV